MKNKKYNITDGKQRFSIRKLTIGATSVLLGTVFYLNANAGVVHADQVAANTVNTSESNIDKQNDQTSNPDQELKNNKDVENTSLANKVDNQADQTTEIVSKKDKIIGAAQAANKDQTISASKMPNSIAQSVKPKAKMVSAQKAQANETSFTSDKSQIDSGDKIIFNFKTNEAKAGDVYKIVIPEIDDNFDASGTYHVEVGKASGDYVNVNIAEDNNKQIVTDTITRDSTIAQPIILTTYANFNSVLHSTGNFDRNVYLYKNDELIKTISFKQKVSDTPTLSWANRTSNGNPYEGSIFTMNGYAVKNATIKANEDYEWDLDIDGITANFNHGTTITIPMPDNFVMNNVDTKEKNSTLINNFHAEITQKDKSIIVNLPQLTNQELNSLYNLSFPRFKLVGSFVMAEPDQDTKLISQDRPTLVANTGEQVPKSWQTTPAYVNMVNKSSLSDFVPGESISLSIGPDNVDSKLGNVTYIEDTDSHGLNKQIGFTNETVNDLKNFTATIDVPDGMDITSLSGSQSIPNISKCQLILDDGTTYEANVNYIEAPTGHFIKKINLVFDDFLPYESVEGLNLLGTLAQKYANGNEVKVNDKLTTNLSVTADNLLGKGLKSCTQTIANKPIIENVHVNDINANVFHPNNDPGTKDAGYVDIKNNDLTNDSEQLTYYVALPTNTTFNINTGIKNLPNGAQLSEFAVNNQIVVKITGNFDAKDAIELALDNQDIIDKEISDEDYSVYVALPHDQTLEYPYTSHTTDAEAAYVENSTNAYRLNKGTWEILASLGSYSASQAQGNNDALLTSDASSDDKKSADMNFSTVIVNSQDNNLNNVVVITNVPGQDDSKSEYNLTLKNKDSVNVVDKGTDMAITNGITQYYSMDNINLNNAKKDPNLMSHFVVADQVTDWSKIKSVLTKIDQIPKSTVYSVVFNAKDSNILIDANKTAYTSSVFWTDNLNPFVINPGSDKSASIKITGKSTVNFKLHFEDNSKSDISIPSLSHVYQDGADIMQLSDFITAKKNSDYDEAVKKQDYSKISKAIIDAIPADYVLRVENGAHIENSDSSDPNNLPAEFDKKVQYYFDGDTVVFDLVKKEDIDAQKVVVNRIIHFVDKNDKTIQNDYTDSTTPVIIKGKINPLTGAAYIPDITQLLKNQSLAKYSVPAVINGYAIDLDNPNNPSNVKNSSNKDIEKISIEEISENLIEKYVSNYVDSKGVHYSIDTDNKVTNITKDKPVDVNTTEFDQVITLYYAPSHANLILIGQNLNQDNQLLDSSSNVNQDGSVNDSISFSKSDSDLQKAGYTYKVYYQDSSLYKYNLRYGYTPKDYNAIHYIFAAELDNGKQYDNLRDALLAQSKYDDQYDGTNNNIADYTQNFFVVYSPIENKNQNLYILSDDDPYANDNAYKPYALPKTIQQSEQTGDHFKLTGKSGDSLVNLGYQFPAFSSDSWPYDENMPVNLSGLSVYKRTGYYIQSATYQVTDDAGKIHKITVTNNFNADNFKTSGYYGGTGTDQMLDLLDKLTKLTIPYDSAQVQLKDPNQNPVYEITIDGISGIKIDDTSGCWTIPADKKWSFDSTKYGNSKVDPAPQTITIHYAALPVTDQATSIRIHYVDVDGIDPLTDADYNEIATDYYTNLDKNTYKYSAFYLANQEKEIPEILFNSDQTSITTSPLNVYSTEQATINVPISEIGQEYDNTNEDQKILKLLGDKYVVVQRDKQTIGKQFFDPYATDNSNGTYNNNQLRPEIMGGDMPPEGQDYYVYLKRAQPIKYRVLVEDEKGNVEKDPLVKTTPLGIGANGDNIASTTIKLEDGTTKTLGARYADLLKGTDDIFKNYDIVAPNSTDTKLKKSDSLDNALTFTDPDKEKPKLLTIYVTHKKGSVHIHYIDVSGKQPDKDGNFQSTDGTEIAKQDVKDKNYGDPYTNTLWDYSSHGYKLATKDIPAGTTGGTIFSTSTDVYVYLEKKTQTINYQVLVEDEKGNVEKDPLVKTTPLGTGATGDNIASTTIKLDNGTTKTLGARYADLLKGTGDIFKDYDIVAPDSADSKLKKSDSLDNALTFTDPDKEQPKLLTIYVTHKKGSVHIHYIDVSGKQPDKDGNFQSTDGTEIAKQDIKDKNYGDPYTNTLWDYSSHGYKLATKDIPVGATSGTISKSSTDVYVYLEKKTQTINYRVLVEDENGNVEKTLVEPTKLGSGNTGDNISSTKDGLSTIGEKYQNLLDQKYDNYDIVGPDSTNTKLKKSDSLDNLTFTDPDKEQPKTLTIYVTHKKGSVHIHYIDVSGKKPGKDGNYKPENGTELTDEKQDYTKNYGDSYTNTLWGYSSHGYKLATKDIPVGATSGTISNVSTDIYVYLTKVSDGGGNIPPTQEPGTPDIPPISDPHGPTQEPGTPDTPPTSDPHGPTQEPGTPNTPSTGNPHDPVKIPDSPKDTPKSPVDVPKKVVTSKPKRDLSDKRSNKPATKSSQRTINYGFGKQKLGNARNKVNSEIIDTKNIKIKPKVAKTLPQTSEKPNNLSLLGLLLAGNATLFSLLIDRKHKNK